LRPRHSLVSLPPRGNVTQHNPAPSHRPTKSAFRALHSPHKSSPHSHLRNKNKPRLSVDTIRNIKYSCFNASGRASQPAPAQRADPGCASVSRRAHARHYLRPRRRHAQAQGPRCAPANRADRPQPGPAPPRRRRHSERNIKLRAPSGTGPVFGTRVPLAPHTHRRKRRPITRTAPGVLCSYAQRCTRYALIKSDACRPPPVALFSSTTHHSRLTIYVLTPAPSSCPSNTSSAARAS
jgi:hypothetical protein